MPSATTGYVVLTDARQAEAISPCSGRRLTLALLGYYLAVVAVITLVPFRFVVPEQLQFLRIANWPDFLANILLFLPFGFLYRAARSGTGAAETWLVVSMGALASAAIECLQLFEPDRYPSAVDILANTLGAAAGALLCRSVLRRIRAPGALIGRLSLELPLMGLLYLTVPLLWVGSLSVGDSALRLWMLALPVTFAGTLLGFIQRHHFGPAGAASDRQMAAVAAAGVLLGGFPALSRAPHVMLLLAGAAAAVVLLHARRPASAERRFELPALAAALPFYASYLLACALAPLVEPGGALGPGGSVDATLHSIEILRLLHAAAAFTLLGYALAELRGRLELPFRAAAARIVAWSVPIALATRLVGMLALGPHGTRAAAADLLWITLTVGGALYGGWIYHLQREHVRRLLAA